MGKVVPATRSAVILISAILVGSPVVPLVSTQHHAGRGDSPAVKPCKVAVSISGADVRSFVNPAVHQSFRRYVVRAIEENGCQVDVFAYAMLEDDVDLLLEDNPEFVAGIAEIEASIDFLSPTPTQLVWHQDQAGMIDNSCPGSPLHFRDDSAPIHTSNGDDVGTDVVRDGSGKGHQEAYWQLYGSLAAYRMVLQNERKRNESSAGDGDFSYDWIVDTRFGALWVRPLPPLHLFSKEVVWFGTNVWPMSNDFALIPRSLGDRYFSAVSAFHSCDPALRPPRHPWWQPNCRSNGGGGLAESVLFQHLHANDVGYRPYPLFEYCVLRQRSSGGGADGDERSGAHSFNFPKAAADYGAACIIMEATGLFRPSYSSGDCTAALAEYSNLLCRALTRPQPSDAHGDDSEIDDWSENDTGAAIGGLDDPRAALKAFMGASSSRAYSAGVRARDQMNEQDKNKTTAQRIEAMEGEAFHSLHSSLSKLIALRDAVMLDAEALRVPSVDGVTDINVDSESTDITDKSQQQRRRLQNRRKDEEPVSSEVLHYSWTIHSLEGCLIGEHPGQSSHTIRSFRTEKYLLQELAVGVKCLADQLVARVSAGSANESARAAVCAGIRPLELVMIDVYFHSEELGICTVDGSMGLTAVEHVQRFFAEPSAHCVGYDGRQMKGDRASARAASPFTTDATPTSSARKEHIGRENLAALAVDTGTATAAANLQEVVAGSKVATAGEPARLPETTVDPLSTSCLDLLVQAMEVSHPKDGAVYWEGPVKVSLEVTLTGPGLQGLSLRHVHACADTEESWPIVDRSRLCVPLEDLASPDSRSSLVFGSTIGVVEGSVSLRDARPGCFPEGHLRGPVLRTTTSSLGDDRNQQLASRSMRFKIIHHEDTFRRRGRPIGPAPLGRGFATIQEFIRDLEREAGAESEVGLAELESYLNHSRIVSSTTRKTCTSRLDIEGRGGALAISGLFAKFYADQMDWMISKGKLPPEMSFAVDRMREVQSIIPDESAGEPSFAMIVRQDVWQHVAQFFQKSLLLPAPDDERVVSTAPLQTWEYDEIPWMQALNPDVDWHAVEEAYLGNEPVSITHVNNFFSPKALAFLLDLARGNSIFVDGRKNYIGAYPSEGMSHPLLYQIAEEAAERLPRILGPDTTGWPLVQMWFYVYGGNNGQRCASGIKAHADSAMVNLNVWLTPDSANLGGPDTGDGGGLTVFHAKPPEEWSFSEFNTNESAIEGFLAKNLDTGYTSVSYRQNRALIFDSMLIHQSDPFRFRKGFENRRLNLTLLFGKLATKSNASRDKAMGSGDVNEERNIARDNAEMREISPGEGDRLRYCL